ncbi:hypothetical protein GGI07_003486 [Coemansia sp. Benny D115]|nr:hypothetical protein GGI07_003486 [Coemansia sp. Benny D115]
MSTNIASLYEANLSSFANSAPASNIPNTFGPPALMGSTLGSLKSTSSPDFAAQMPGIVFGGGSDAQAASNEPPKYYMAYDGEDNKVLWFQVEVTPDGDEIITGHGWQDKA